MGIQKPNLYGAGKDIARNLQSLTPHSYFVKRARAKASDIKILDPNGFDIKKLNKPQHSIVKEE